MGGGQVGENRKGICFLCGPEVKVTKLLISGVLRCATLRYGGSDTRFPSLGDYIQVQKYSTGLKGCGDLRGCRGFEGLQGVMF